MHFALDILYPIGTVDNSDIYGAKVSTVIVSGITGIGIAFFCVFLILLPISFIRSLIFSL